MLSGNHGGFFYTADLSVLQVFPGGDPGLCLLTYSLPSGTTDADIHQLAWARIDSDMDLLCAIADRRYANLSPERV